jgi:hypothetical protein
VSTSGNLIQADGVEKAMARMPWPLQEKEPVILGIDPSRLRQAMRGGRRSLLAWYDDGEDSIGA